MKYIFFFFFLLFSVMGMAQQEYRTHTVKEGETIYRISKRYNVSQDEIFRLNPDVRDGVKEGDLLIIPKEETEEIVEEERKVPVQQDTNYIVHHVQPKETLYGLSKMYGISIEDLLLANPDLKDGLKIGGLVYIPKDKIVKKEAEILPQEEDGYAMVQVSPKQTVYSICKQYGLSEEEFYTLNPHVKEIGLQIGQKIKVPDESVVENGDKLIAETDSKEEDNNFFLYQLMADENLDSIVKRFGVKRELIIKLNPELIDESNLAEGMYIILPGSARDKNVVNNAVDINSEWISSIELDQKKLKVTLILPFFLPINDSIEMASGYGESAEIYKRTKTAIEFYNGFKLAMDTLVYFGVDVEIQVIDSENDIEKLKRQKSKIWAFTPDFIMGPLYAQNAKWVADNFEDIPVISPLSRATDNNGIENLVNCYTNENGELLGLIDVINENYADAHLVFVNPDNEENKNSVAFIKQNLISTSEPDIEELWFVDEYPKEFVYADQKSKEKKTVWITTSKDPVFLNDYLTKMYSLHDSTMIILGLSRIEEIQTVENHYLSRLNFRNTSRDFIDYKSTKTEDFILRYRKLTNTEPTSISFKAYDAGIYFGFLTARFNSLPLDRSWPEYQGLNSGFLFKKELNAGPQNYFIHLLGITDFERIKY